ncbi:glycosyltransferase family 4 protein [Brachybacterium sp. Z12]|nr:glycosyltransferase family 4 protein [Brachybacterium sp. Z12]QNN82250.1 glycosyltransferase family 4 protein [Brachybacterium sp. Z12]
MRDGLPLKPFEAMAMGKAVVASDVAALAEIVTPE